MNFNVNDIKKEIQKLENNDINKKFKKKVFDLMTKNDLNWSDVSLLMKNTTLYFDYDEVIADLIGAWLIDINMRNNTNYTKSDVTTWNWFSKQKNGMKFLTDVNDTYKNVKVEPIIFKFFLALGRNEMINNVTIVTATHPATYLSKIKHFEEKVQAPAQLMFQKELGINFPLNFENDFVTTKRKEKLDFYVKNSILLDDGGHNAMSVVEENDYAYVLLLNYSHNEYLQTGSRIKRLHHLEDFFFTLTLTTLEAYDKRNRKKQDNLLEEIKNK